MSGRSSRPGKLRVRSLKVHEIRRTYFAKTSQKKYGDNFAKYLKKLVIPTGIEPVTYRLGICRSILLSYGTTRPDT